MLGPILAVALVASPTVGPTAADRQEHRPPIRTVFAEHFGALDLGPGRTWGWQSAAYQNCTDNPGTFKLDHLTAGAVSVGDGRLLITAAPAASGDWDTGLITTGDSCDSGGSGVQVRTGDLMTVHVRLPSSDSGAWPALWTWRDGRNEVDVFEWHSDQPGTLEFVNHVRSGNTYYRSPDIGAGRWLWIGARFGADNVIWYVGTTPDHLTSVFEDHTGVGPDFAAYPILSLSVDRGDFHPAPAAKAPITLEADSITIERPAPPRPVRTAQR